MKFIKVLLVLLTILIILYGVDSISEKQILCVKECLARGGGDPTPVPPEPPPPPPPD